MNATPPDPELEDLLRQVDRLLDDDPDDIDITQYQPRDAGGEPMLYRNHANGYGAQVRNFANGYGEGQPREHEPAARPIPAYNADFRRDIPREERSRPTPAKPVKPRRRRGCCGCLPMMLMLAVALAALWHFWVVPPGDGGEARKDNTATVLLCGTDKDGTRTDTVMLLYLSGSENRIGLLSLPRDTYTVTATGRSAKLNSAYGRNGCGEEGMEGLLDYVQDIIGYRPDGYVLVDFSLVPKVVNAMGGLEFDVPMDMTVGKTSLKAGLQQLSGKQVLALLRYRKGYATADLGRVQVQRQVLEAAMEQWLSPTRIGGAVEALRLLKSGSLSDLTVGNYLWMAQTALFSLNGVSNDTLPGYATMIGGASYYVLKPDQVAQLIDSTYNPLTTAITADCLNIAG